jgi:ATP/maltotriose-dependent transcriptional regulator MalT
VYWFEVATTVAYVLVFATALGYAAYRARLPRPLRRLDRLLTQGRYDEALAAQVPSGRHRADVLCQQALAALALGDVAAVERLLDQAGRTPDVGAETLMIARWVLASCRTHVGRYDDAINILAAIPNEGMARLLRAMIAAEQGEDDLAEELLTERQLADLDEALRLRTLGVLRAQQGAYDEGDWLLAEAVRKLRSDLRNAQVDIAVILARRAEVAVEAGHLDAAKAYVDIAVDAMEGSPQHVLGTAAVHCAAVQVRARHGNAEAALTHLERVRAAVASTYSPPLQADLDAAEAEVAAATSDYDAARAHLTRAIALHDKLGERPAADRRRRGLKDFE